MNPINDGIHINTRDEHGVSQPIDAETARAIQDASDKLKQAYSIPAAKASENEKTPLDYYHDENFPEPKELIELEPMRFELTIQPTGKPIDAWGVFSGLRDIASSGFIITQLRQIDNTPSAQSARDAQTLKVLRDEIDRLNSRDVNYQTKCPACDGRGHPWIDDALDPHGAAAEAIGDVKQCDACGGSGTITMLDYPAAARSIALHLDLFCDKSKPYPDMIADAARLASKEIERLAALIAQLETKEQAPVAVRDEGDGEIARLKAIVGKLSESCEMLVSARSGPGWVIGNVDLAANMAQSALASLAATKEAR